MNAVIAFRSARGIEECTYRAARARWRSKQPSVRPTSNSTLRGPTQRVQIPPPYHGLAQNRHKREYTRSALRADCDRSLREKRALGRNPASTGPRLSEGGTVRSNCSRG